MNTSVCDYEEFTIHTSSVGASSNVDYVCALPVPLKDVVEASITSVYFRVRFGGNPAYYIAVDELHTRRTDFAPANAPATSTGSDTHQIDTSNLRLRDALGAIYPDILGVSREIIFKDRYDINAKFFNPLRKLDKLSIKIYQPNGQLALDPTAAGKPTEITFRFKCKRKNFC